MESAYLYVRVSTDEQKKKGYSPIEQEDRLLKHCELNNIKIKGIFREDFSAKNFNRPEWKKLITEIKKKRSDEENSILFIKWDRFSRNIEYAYEMIGILRKYNAVAMAIDQPIDFMVPESTVMLAVYLSIPEAENSRRALNTLNGIRRAKQMGRYPNKAPIGYLNLTAPDGKKFIAPHHPEAELIQWSFQQLAKNAYRVDQVRKMSNAKGLKCSKSRFWKLLRNPIYCGYVSLRSTESDEIELIKGIHEALIPELLFYEVQNIINTKRKIVGNAHEINEMFMLRRYLICPVCNRKLSGSFSTGKTKRYPYYHCTTGCKTRFKADCLNNGYEDKLNQIELSSGALKLLGIILEDINVSTQREHYLCERKSLLKQIEEQEFFVSKARRLFIDDKIQFDDFTSLKKEYKALSNDLKSDLQKVTIKLNCIDKQFSMKPYSDLISNFRNLDINDKKYIINLIPPTNIDVDGDFSLCLNKVLSKILLVKNDSKYQLDLNDGESQSSFSFKERKVSIKKAICILAQNNINIDDDEATVILNFLYVIAKSTPVHKVIPDLNHLKRNSNSEKTPLFNNLNDNRPDFKLV